MSTFSLYSRRFVGWIITMFLLVLVVHLSRSAWGLWQMRSRVTDAEAEVRALAEKKDQREKQVAAQSSPFAIEKEIRDKLQMAKPGETVVIIPGGGLHTSGDNLQVETSQRYENAENVPNWKRWWEVLNP